MLLPTILARFLYGSLQSRGRINGVPAFYLQILPLIFIRHIYIGQKYHPTFSVKRLVRLLASENKKLIYLIRSG